MSISISCKCITYGRIDTLEEIIYSYLIQEYDGESELVIVNDFPEQKLYFDHPRIKIFNFDQTFETIGDKENFAISQCAYDTIAVWDDDDIAMKNHLYNINKYFKEGSDLLHWQRGVLFNSGTVSAITSLGNSGIVYSKSIWEKLGRHAKENAGYDMTFVLKIKYNSKNIILADPPDQEVSWFYCWANRSYHMSGCGADVPDRPNIIQRHCEHIQNLKNQGKIPIGNITLNPRWNLQYDQLLKQYLENQG